MKIFEKQLWHLISLIILIYGIIIFVDFSTLEGEFWGISTKTWLIYSVGIAIVHQIYVLLVWRLELYYSSISKFLGKAGFKFYTAGFSIMFISRSMLILALSISSRNSLQINPIIAYLIAFIFLLIALYLIYSVLRYFGLKRAYGIDHFDESYRNKKFVKRGIFRFSNNAMYKFGFLFIWIPGLLLLSKPAIIVALFQHIYIWVHFYFTELPDMKNIYSQIK